MEALPLSYNEDFIVQKMGPLAFLEGNIGGKVWSPAPFLDQ